MGGGPGGDGRDEKDKKVRIFPILWALSMISSETVPAEGQAEIRAPAATYNPYRQEEAQGCRPKHCFQAARYLPDLEM